jgi:hypothetical protein
MTDKPTARNKYTEAVIAGLLLEPIFGTPGIFDFPLP